MSIAALLLCALLCTLPGWAGQAVIRSDEQPADTLIVLQMGACERQCPVYKIVLFADGSGVFDGRHYVRRPGVMRFKIGLEVLGKLVAEADAIRFFELKSRYLASEPGAGVCETPKPDAPIAVLTLSGRGRAKTLQHNRGCGGGDAVRLKQFEDWIVEATQVSKWIR